MDERHVHRESHFAISFITMKTLTSWKILGINWGITVKYFRCYAEPTIKILGKKYPHLSKCFQFAIMSPQVSVKITDNSNWLWILPLLLCALRWLKPSVPFFSWAQNSDSGLSHLPPDLKQILPFGILRGAAHRGCLGAENLLYEGESPLQSESC